MIRIVGVKLGLVTIVMNNQDKTTGYDSLAFTCSLPYHGNKIMFVREINNSTYSFDTWVKESYLKGSLYIDNKKYNVDGRVYEKGNRLFKCETIAPDTFIMIIGKIL